MDKIKVVWICHLMNEDVSKLCIPPKTSVFEYAVWVTNAICEFEKFSDIELHVISYVEKINPRIQSFVCRGINYHIYKPEFDSFKNHLLNKIGIRYLFKESKKDRKIIRSLINEICPDIVHVIGAENVNYASSIFDIPQNTPTIVSLQTMLSEPGFEERYTLPHKIYKYRSEWEKRVIKRADYIATTIPHFREIVKKYIKPHADFLNMELALAPQIHMEETQKEYDFVYFAANIEKGGDEAIDSFIQVCKKKKHLTMNVVGGYNLDFKNHLEKKLNKCGLSENVVFSGRLPSHEDVMKQIRKSKIAVIPLKVDMISSTVREAMANGLPVVTTITPLTPKLNKERESVLLSGIGDNDAMSDNMLKLIDSLEFANKLRKNSFLTFKERYDNYIMMCKWREAYYFILGR